MKRLISLMILAATPALAQQPGDVCTPGSVADRPGLACLPATLPDGRREWALDPTHILNARVGDSTLSSGCGRVGKLLSQVQPGQLYGHTGIMVEDRYALRNSTAAADRMQAYPVGSFGEPTDGFRTDVVRFGWPGTITQSVSGAYEGEYLSDPEDGKRYRLKPFSDRPDAKCDLQVPAAVLKPAPDEELAHPWVRPLLADAAKAATKIDGHYRFYGYTDGSLFDVAPAMAGWAAGSVPTVCSTFVRAAMKAAGAHLEGTLEPTDCVGDAACAVGTALPDAFDGMYLYDEAERAAAAAWLNADLLAEAEEKAGDLGVFLFDAASDVANQITNCFAFDWCGHIDEGARDLMNEGLAAACDEEDAKDSTCWSHPGVGRTTSPDDMMRWDPPSLGGVYGHKEDLATRPSAYFVQHRWQAAADFGDVHGVVRYQGQAMGKVEVNADGIYDFTDVGGRYAVIGLPAGAQTLQACIALDNGTLLGGGVEVDVIAGDAIEADIDLQIVPSCWGPPTTRWTRRVSIGGQFTIIDDEFWTANEVKTFDVAPQEAILQPLPGLDRHTFTFTACHGGEVRGQFEVIATLRAKDGQPVVETVMKVVLREGSSCDLDEDVERRYQVEADVGPSVTHLFHETIVSNEWDSNDTIKTQIMVTNQPVEGSDTLVLP